MEFGHQINVFTIYDFHWNMNMMLNYDEFDLSVQGCHMIMIIEQVVNLRN